MTLADFPAEVMLRRIRQQYPTGYRWRSRPAERKPGRSRLTGPYRKAWDAGFRRRPADFANGIQVVFVRLGVPGADDEAGPGSTRHLRRRLPAERSTEPRKA